MSFKDRPFSERIKGMGDQAEKRFEENSPWPFYRYGLNRPDFKLNQVSQMVRNTPDYLTEQYLVEVQGLGASRVLHMKPNKLRSLHEWHKQMPVLLFVYDATQNRDTFLTLKTVTGLCEVSKIKKFPEGNEYYAINVDLAWSYGKQGISLSLIHI
mgnify:FL=1